MATGNDGPEHAFVTGAGGRGNRARESVHAQEADEREEPGLLRIFRHPEVVNQGDGDVRETTAKSSHQHGVPRPATGRKEFGDAVELDGASDGFDGELGERVGAVVVVAEPVTPESLVQHCASGLASFKVPEYVEFAPELPFSALGKLDRKALRAQLQDAPRVARGRR